MMWVRSFDSLEARPLAGTEGARGVFWSPDSRFIAFGSGFAGKLKKVDVSGGAPQTLCDYPGQLRNGAWSRQGLILFGVFPGGLFRVSEDGGPATQVTTVDPSRLETQHAGPTFLPDGRYFLYHRASYKAENRGTYLGSIDAKPEQQSTKLLLSADSDLVYVSSANSGSGYVLFLREGSLMAQLFDNRGLEFKGEAIPLAEQVGNSGSYGWFSASVTGALAFRNGTSTLANTQLLWFNRQGGQSGQVGPPADYVNLQLFPDGKRVVVDKGNQARGTDHAWIGDVARGVFSRLNPGDAAGLSPAVSPDGHVAFSGVTGDIYWTSASGVGAAELLVKSPLIKHPNHVSLDGRYLIYDEHHPSRGQDLYILPLFGDRKPIPFLVTNADETFGQFSPDGKWIAYSSDESGRREVYVQGFAPDHVPAVSTGKWLISTAGGDKPRWRRDGKELYYLADGKMMAVPLKTAPVFEPGVAVPLFDTPVTGFAPYDVSADGRFLVNTLIDAAAPNSSPVTVVLNWQAGLKK